MKLNWTRTDKDGSRFAEGKQNFYAIIVYEDWEKTKDWYLGLFITPQPMTALEIKQKGLLTHYKLQLWNGISDVKYQQKVEHHLSTAQNIEDKNRYS